jgi:hypothetical protein
MPHKIFLKIVTIKKFVLVSTYVLFVCPTKYFFLNSDHKKVFTCKYEHVVALVRGQLLEGDGLVPAEGGPQVSGHTVQQGLQSISSNSFGHALMHVSQTTPDQVKLNDLLRL